MTDFKKLTGTLEELGYTVRCFDTADQAAEYLDRQIDGRTVSFGGSVTLQEMLRWCKDNIFKKATSVILVQTWLF